MIDTPRSTEEVYAGGISISPRTLFSRDWGLRGLSRLQTPALFFPVPFIVGGWFPVAPFTAFEAVSFAIACGSILDRKIEIADIPKALAEIMDTQEPRVAATLLPILTGQKIPARILRRVTPLEYLAFLTAVNQVNDWEAIKEVFGGTGGGDESVSLSAAILVAVSACAGAYTPRQVWFEIPLYEMCGLVLANRELNPERDEEGKPKRPTKLTDKEKEWLAKRYGKKEKPNG